MEDEDEIVWHVSLLVFLFQFSVRAHHVLIALHSMSIASVVVVFVVVVITFSLFYSFGHNCAVSLNERHRCVCVKREFSAFNLFWCCR